MGEITCPCSWCLLLGHRSSNYSNKRHFSPFFRFYGAGTHPLKSLKLMGKSGTRKCYLRVPDLQMRCRHMIRMGGYQGCNFEDGNTSMDRHGHPLNKPMMDQLIVPFIRHHTRVVNSSRFEVLTPSPLRDVDDVSQLYCSTPFYELKSWSCPVKIAYGGCHGTPLGINQHCFR